MYTRKDLQGQTFNNLTVISFDHADAHGHSFWACQCKCENTRTLRSDAFISGKIIGCGCSIGRHSAQPFSYITDQNNCHICSSHSYDSDGYPRAKRNDKAETIARILFKQHHPELVDGTNELPKGMHVCHRCDNRACINPVHLYLGTPYANVQDSILRNRNTKGELHGLSKLNASQALSIFNNTSISRQSLATMYGVSVSAITHVQNGDTWQHLTKLKLITGNATFGVDNELILEWQSDADLLAQGFVRD